jgi:hypothetical protein
VYIQSALFAVRYRHRHILPTEHVEARQYGESAGAGLAGMDRGRAARQGAG